MKKILTKQLVSTAFLRAVWQRLLPLPWICAAVFAAIYGVRVGWAWFKTETVIPVIYRDAVMAVYADWRAGDPVYLDEIDYSQSGVHDPNDTWDMMTNSDWLVTQARMIVPFMSYEKIVGKAFYPDIIYFMPYTDMRSLQVLGSAGWSFFGGLVVQINERFTQPPDNDVRELLGTLVHELIHIQGGDFYFEKSEVLESKTSAATIEVLAAMCNYSQPYACQAFWYEMSQASRSSLKYYMYKSNLGWLFERFADAFLRDDAEDVIAAKRLRFWADRPDEYQDILEKYGWHPWNTHVVPGITKHYKTLDTGNKIADGDGKSVYLGMPWDDTKVVLGEFWTAFLRFLT